MDTESARRLITQLAPLHTRKALPRPGDWLAARASGPCLQPIDDVDESVGSIRQILATGVHEFYGFDVRQLPTIELGRIPASAQRRLGGTDQQQLLTPYLLEHVAHCTLYECGMNGSNSLAESDQRPLEFCPECQAKIWWTCGILPEVRCEVLMRFAREQGFGKEAVYGGAALPLLTAGQGATG